MSSTDEARPEPEHYYLLHCPCGLSLEGATEDEIVDRSFEHLREKHPHMEYEREHILFMALKLRK